MQYGLVRVGTKKKPMDYGSSNAYIAAVILESLVVVLVATQEISVGVEVAYYYYYFSTIYVYSEARKEQGKIPVSGAVFTTLK